MVIGPISSDVKRRRIQDTYGVNKRDGVKGAKGGGPAAETAKADAADAAVFEPSPETDSQNLDLGGGYQEDFLNDNPRDPQSMVEVFSSFQKAVNFALKDRMLRIDQLGEDLKTIRRYIKGVPASILARFKRDDD